VLKQPQQLGKVAIPRHNENSLKVARNIYK